MKDLKILVPENFLEFGQKVEKHLRIIRENDYNYISPILLPRFNNGESKGVLGQSVRGKDIYILSDVTNYDISYKAHCRINYKSTDDHVQDIKRLLNAVCRHANRITLITPYLPYCRQDKRACTESLDCAIFLKECEKLGVNEFITFDLHNPAVCNAVPNTPFDNFYPTDDLLFSFLSNEELKGDNVIVVSPDEGAMKRAKLFAEMLGDTDYGTFSKVRNSKNVVNGNNPIQEHRFLGPNDLTGKDVILVDDMIDSGGSILKAAKDLKTKNANRIYFMVTYALLSNGIEAFESAYKEGYFDKLYATNLSYIPDRFKDNDWLEEVDCSKKIAHIINRLNLGKSISNCLDSRDSTVEKIKMLRRNI